MTAKIIDGKARAAQLRADIKQSVTHLADTHNIQPGLAVIIVGTDPASQIYVRNKIRQTTEAGMKSHLIELNENISQTELIAQIDQLNDDPSIHGILVQLPLPAHLDSHTVTQRIMPEKDVDGFHITNVGRLAIGLDGIIPCTPRGCMLLLEEALGSLTGKNALIIGRSNIVGKPMAQLLLQADATVTIAHSRTQDLENKVRQADIVVAAVGVPELVKGDWVKPGAVILDVGINRIEDAGDGDQVRLVGDVEFDRAKETAAAITPVPGGVGPMTIASLLANTLTACCRQHNIDETRLT